MAVSATSGDGRSLALDAFKVKSRPFPLPHQTVEVIGPVLHHPPTLGDILRVIVCGADLVPLVMRDALRISVKGIMQDRLGR